MARRNRILSWFVISASLLCGAAAQTGRIAFTSDRSGSWQIYTMNPDGSDQVQVTNLTLTDEDLLVPSISPNGRQIAFDYNSGDGPDLYLVNVDGTGLHALTNDHLSLWPRWSPDGKRIIFSGVSQKGTAVLITIATDGSGKRKTLTTDLWESVGGVYTPDGKQIVFGSQMGGLVSAVWIMNADGSHPRRLTPAPLKAQSWNVSPDGKSILAYTNQNSPPALGNHIIAMNLDGSGRKRLAPMSKFHHDLYPSFSPDGTKITFISDRFSTDIDPFTYGTWDILTVNADGSVVADIASRVGSCPHDGNCVTPFWGVDQSESHPQSNRAPEETGSRISLSLSVAPNPAVAGEPVTMIAFCSMMHGNQPGPCPGSAQFKDGKVVIGSAIFRTRGFPWSQAQFTTSEFSVGTHRLRAVYSGKASKVVILAVHP